MRNENHDETKTEKLYILNPYSLQLPNKYRRMSIINNFN